MTRPSILTRSPLGQKLARALELATKNGQPYQTTLKNGLTIRATTNPNRLCLWRKQGQWGPGEASEREGRVCARAVGWSSHTLEWSKSGKYLTATEGEALL